MKIFFLSILLLFNITIMSQTLNSKYWDAYIQKVRQVNFDSLDEKKGYEFIITEKIFIDDTIICKKTKMVTNVNLYYGEQDNLKWASNRKKMYMILPEQKKIVISNVPPESNLTSKEILEKRIKVFQDFKVIGEKAEDSLVHYTLIPATDEYANYKSMIATIDTIGLDLVMLQEEFTKGDKTIRRETLYEFNTILLNDIIKVSDIIYQSNGKIRQEYAGFKIVNVK